VASRVGVIFANVAIVFAILFAAVCMLGWHNGWTSRHAKEHVVEATGAKPLYARAPAE